MMELDFDDTVARGLHRYVQLVSRALGLHGECSYVQADESVSAYLALDGRLSDYPHRDVALLWEETRGWSAAIETHSGEDLLVVAHLGRDVLPPPEAVAAWVRELFHPHDLAPVGHFDERRTPANVETTRGRLAAYAGPAFADQAYGTDGAPLAIG